MGYSIPDSATHTASALCQEPTDADAFDACQIPPKVSLKVNR